MSPFSRVTKAECQNAREHGRGLRQGRVALIQRLHHLPRLAPSPPCGASCPLPRDPAVTVSFAAARGEGGSRQREARARGRGLRRAPLFRLLRRARRTRTPRTSAWGARELTCGARPTVPLQTMPDVVPVDSSVYFFGYMGCAFALIFASAWPARDSPRPSRAHFCARVPSTGPERRPRRPARVQHGPARRRAPAWGVARSP